MERRLDAQCCVFYSLQIDFESKFTHFKIFGQGVDKEPKGILTIDEITGEMRVHGRVDFEKYQVFHVSFFNSILTTISCEV